MQDTTRVLFLKELKEFLKTSDIKADKVCIVGSSSLAALGIRENRDIDLICHSTIRQQVIKELKQNEICDKIEVVNKNWSYFDDSINDNQIIEDSEKHFLFCGIKFVSIELLQHRKLQQNRPKDASDLKKIRKYLDSQCNG